MIELVGIAGSAFLVAFSGALVPGPMLAVTLGETPGSGPATGLFVALGHSILELALLIAILLGFDALFTSPAVSSAIGLIGGAMLVFMGATMILEARKAAPATPGATLGGRRRSVPGLMYEGVYTSVSNPYFFLWWATVGLGYIVISRKFGPAGIAVFYAGHISADIVYYSFVSATLHFGRGTLGARGLKALSVACAAALLCFGAYFAHSGLKGLSVI